jgi:peptide/nickel transport system permease protein
MSAYLLLVGTLFVIINFVVDMLYFLIDPRIKQDHLNGGGS